MKQVKCDVTVIGSGVGGITVAALLAKAGYKTLVVEKLPFAGGRCATLDHHGFRINTGAAMIGEEIHGVLCREVGAELELRVPENVFIFRVNGKDYPAPHKGVLKTIIGKAARDDAEAERVYKAFLRSVTWSEPSYSMSLDDWARQYTENPSLLRIFQFFTTAVGMNSYEMPAGEFFRSMTEGAVITWAYPPLGGGQFSDAMVGAIKRMGGDVWTRCPAVQVKVKNGAAAGVVVQKDGKEIEILAQAVISNTPPWRTVEMVGREHLGPGYLKDVGKITGAPMICFHMTSDRQLLEGSSVLGLTESLRLYNILDYTPMCPEMSPKGKHLLEAITVPTSVFPPYDIKKEVAMTLQDLRNVIPDFDNQVQILRINIARGDWGVTGNIPGRGTLPTRTPVYGLYSVGDRSAPPGWWCSLAAIKSGRLVAEDVMKR
ncbi:MAG: NAD(P)/FAD-dependent oxidoreductase, partial [Dehalococcoidia bacterium]